jgi:hypothetical protein
LEKTLPDPADHLAGGRPRRERGGDAEDADAHLEEDHAAVRAAVND